MTAYKIGDQVLVILGKLPVVGTIVFHDKKRDQYLVRIGTVQDYYVATEMKHFTGKSEDIELFAEKHRK